LENQHYTIKEQVFDIQFGDRSKVHELQNRISRFANDRLIASMNSCFNKLIPGQIHLKIESLTLDIGDVELDSLEERLEQKIIAELELKISQQLAFLKKDIAGISGNGVDVSLIQGVSGLLEYFLLTGLLPWWVQDNRQDIDTFFQDFLSRDPEAARSMIRRIGQYESVRKRLIFQFRDESIRKLIAILEPADAAYILEYHREVVLVQQKEQVVQTEISVFEKSVWLFILNYLLVDRGGEFNRKEFTKSSLRQMAASFNIQYLDLLSLFYQAVLHQVSAERETSSLELLIYQLIREEQDYQDVLLPVTDHGLRNHPGSIAEQMALLRYYFQYGSFPPDKQSGNRDAIAAIFFELASLVPDTLKQVLKETGPGAALAERFYALLGNEQGKQVLHQLFPVNARTIFGFASLLELMQQKAYIALNVTADQLRRELAQLAYVLLVFPDRSGEDALFYIRLFVEQVSNVYGESPEKMIRGIHEGIQREFRHGIIHSNIPELIGSMLQNGGDQITASPMKKEDVSVQEKEDGLPSGMVDALKFIVRFGYIPWWGRSFFQTDTVSSKLALLMTGSPAEFVSLMRFAGTEKRSRARLLSLMELPLMYHVFVLTGADNDFAAFSQSLGKWISELTGAEEIQIARIVTGAYWDELISHGYRQISLTGFYSLVVLRIGEAYSFNAPEIAAIIKEHLLSETASAPSVEIMESLAQLLGDQAAETALFRRYAAEQLIGKLFSENETPAFLKQLITQLPPEHLAELTGLLSENPENYYEKIKAAPDAIKRIAVKEAAEIILYFIRWNKVPEMLQINGQREIHDFLHEMIRFVYVTDSGMLERIFRQPYAPKEIVRELSAIFDGQKDDAERKIQKMLLGFIEPDEEPVGADRKTGTESHIKTEGTERESLYRFLAKGGTLSPETFYEEAIQLLAFFFRWNKAPDHWTAAHGASFRDILKQLFFILFTENRNTLHQLLREQTHVPEARIFFHELVDASKGGAEKEMAVFIAPYKQWYHDALITMERAIASVPVINEDNISVVDIPVDEQNNQRESLILFFDELLRKAPVGGNYFQHIGDEKTVIEKLLQLFIADRNALAELFGREQLLPDAKIRIYELLLKESGYRERELLQFLQTDYLNSILYLMDKTGDTADRSEPVEETMPEKMIRWISDQKPDPKKQNQFSPVFIQQVFDKGNNAQVKRLIEQIIPAASGQLYLFFVGVNELFERSVQNRADREQMKESLRKFYLLLLSDSYRLISKTGLLKAYIAFLLNRGFLIQVEVFQAILSYIEQGRLTAIPGLAGLADEWQMGLLWIINRVTNKRSGILPVQQESQTASDTQEAERKKALADTIKKELEAERQRQEEQLRKESEKIEQDKHNKIYIRNAGLVLLHPFLGTYFTRLGLLEAGKFVDEAAQHRAVLLTQYLVNGRNETEEFELALNKVLCGVSMYETVPLKIELTATEIAVSEEIFQVIFQRWEKMKNSTIAGFRASFIQREGALSRNEENWELRVEQRTYDMLLETLPWSFGMIKSSWMNQILTVEWI
jgi:hypothetical protein